jgi:hypothetical protein
LSLLQSMKKNCKCQGQGERFYIFFRLSILSSTHAECPISIHLHTNTNNKVNKTALCLSSAFRSSLIISFNTIFFILILSDLNKFLFLLITTKRKREQITYHYTYVYILLISLIQIFIINKRYISQNWYISKCSIHIISLDTMYHLLYDITRKKNLIQSQETYTGSKVTYCLLCHYEQKGKKMIASSSSSLFNSK